MEVLLTVIGVVEILGIIVAGILIIPMYIHYEVKAWNEVRDIRKLQLWALIAPVAVIVWAKYSITKVINMYRYPMGKNESNT